MARKSLRDMSGIANTIARSSSTSAERVPKTSAPALGALQGSLASIREIDPGLIDDWGPKDRLDEFTAVNVEDDDEGFEALKNSIREGGQQVPILVRRSKAAEGRFEAIYGRRRLKACRELGIKVPTFRMSMTPRPCWPKGWKMGELNAEKGEILIETLELNYNRFEFKDP